MSDYTAFDEFVSNGRASGGALPGPAVRVAGVPDAVPLSTLHISPFVEYRAGASLLKAHRGGQKDDNPVGGIRGEVKGFSADSRRRLMRTIASVKRDADLPLFITLTYPESFPDARTSKKHIDTFFKRFSRAFPAHGSIWKLEPQKRGAPHYHILTWCVDLEAVQAFVPGAWFDIAGNGDTKHLRWHMGEFHNQHCVQQVYSHNGVMRYASKYLGKTFEVEGWQKVGRYWGTINRANIPFGELVREEVSKAKAKEIMRYQRRFAHLKGSSKKSATVICDADQWVNKIGLQES